MKKCYIFNFIKEVIVEGEGKKKQNFCVMFFPYQYAKKDESDLYVQLREYFHRHILPDRLIVICFSFNQKDIKELFSATSDLFNYIPKFEYDHNQESIHVISLDQKGVFQTVLGKKLLSSQINEIYNRGMVKIFNENGGLIISQKAHHFVFPSGKHCDRFLRTGNVLIHGAQVLFIASSLIAYFKKRTEEIEYIYCDTSSINSLAYAFVNLLKELNPNSVNIHIESFGSYELFEDPAYKFKRNSISLISSSTSGGILERINQERKNVNLDDVAIIYGLKVKSNFEKFVLCDLTIHEKNNPEGIAEFKSDNVNNGDICKFCADGSRAIKVEGDVFLLEKPLVTGHIVKRDMVPSWLNKFGDYYKKCEASDEPILRCYYGESGMNNKYELFIDIETILNYWDSRRETNGRFENVLHKIEKYILQNIPASLKYMVALSDKSSIQLAKIIANVLNENGIQFNEKNILEIGSQKLEVIDQSNKGVIAVISSSVVTGSNLLYLSRALRDFEESHQRIFFNYFNRTSNKQHYDFLQSNLGLGEYGNYSHKIFNVEKIHCVQETRNTPWHKEEDFIKELSEFLETKDSFLAAAEYCFRRNEEFINSGKTKGLSNNLFFPSIKNKTLEIRKGFAFAPYSVGRDHFEFIGNSAQSEIYFIISAILNKLRNDDVLVQSEYVRNLIDPGNFVRFNDGIIQACFLRAANREELNYNLSEEMSLQMKSILGEMISHIEDDHAEGLNEFFYAIAI